VLGLRPPARLKAVLARTRRLRPTPTATCLTILSTRVERFVTPAAGYSTTSSLRAAARRVAWEPSSRSTGGSCTDHGGADEGALLHQAGQRAGDFTVAGAEQLGHLLTLRLDQATVAPGIGQRQDKDRQRELRPVLEEDADQELADLRSVHHDKRPRLVLVGVAAQGVAQLGTRRQIQVKGQLEDQLQGLGDPKGKAGPGRGKKTPPQRSRFTSYSGSSYLAARLKRDHPEIAAAVERGEYKSIRAAARKAGIVKDPNPYDQLLKWWGKASPEDQAQKQIPRVSFLANARTLANTWEEIFIVNNKLLPFEHYRHLANAALPRDRKDALRAWAEQARPRIFGAGTKELPPARAWGRLPCLVFKLTLSA
jgi:hypothetical protein